MGSTSPIPIEPTSLTAFLARLESVPWLSTLGQSLGDLAVKQIVRWEDWPGPEHPGVSELFDQQQSFFDALIAGAGDLQIPEAMKAVEVNVTVTAPGKDTPLFMKDGLFTQGHKEGVASQELIWVRFVPLLPGQAREL